MDERRLRAVSPLWARGRGAVLPLTGGHDDGHGALIRPILLQQIGQGAAMLYLSIHRWASSVTP
ncbi:hypothetical protein [Chloroflexus sp. MS-G]|uniref:hypothetical protein n=1 Tax=Chloroflexus sp. MS-G TaxID=1521187 RepID=UPI000AEBD390|nr:hypothetical protein [Chloroflexus sp. MS-G]